MISKLIFVFVNTPHPICHPKDTYHQKPLAESNNLDR